VSLGKKLSDHEAEHSYHSNSNSQVDFSVHFLGMTLIKQPANFVSYFYIMTLLEILIFTFVSMYLILNTCAVFVKQSSYFVK
jgi:hypothetical protein